MQRFRWLFAVLLSLSALPIATAADTPAAEVRYAAVVYDSASEAGPARDDAENIGFLLSDPMVGNFTLDQLDISAGEAGGSADKVTRVLKGRGANASVAFYYFRDAVEKKFRDDKDAAADLINELPGEAKVIVADGTTSGSKDDKPSLTVNVSAQADKSGTAEFEFSGAAGGSNTVTAILFEALRGYADTNHDRKITVSELAAFLSSKASSVPKFEPAGMGDVVLVSYRTPAQVAQSLGPDKAMDLSAEYIREQRWVESLLMLREIRDSKVTDPRYRDISEVAQLNLSLEARYSPDYKQDNISRDVNTGLELISDMLLLVNLHYVTDVDNRALFAGGTKNLELLLENKRVGKELISTDNPKASGEFKTFLKETAAHVYEKDTLSEGDFVMRVKRVLMENAATVKLPEGVVVTEFVYGIPAALDPNTDLIPRLAYKEFQDDTKGHFGGIGIEIALEDKILTIITPLDGTPGSEAGLLPGDRIVAIEGENTDGIDLTEAVNKLRGPVGTKVVISVVHRGDTAPTDYTITRAEITMTSARGYAADEETGQWDYFVDREKKIGYVRLTDFKENTPEELEKIVDDLLDHGMKALVLDLRFNHGGLLKSGIDVSDEFLTGGIIVTRQGAHTRASTFKAHYFRTFKDFPVVVLVNDQSASAAEIVAAALQENGRATLVGSKTFGKGTVQTVFELEHGQCALKLTTEKYYTPSGKSIHREPYSNEGGLMPDIDVPMSDDESALLVDVWHLRGLRKQARARLMEKDKELAAKNPDMKVADPDTFRDPQLEKALAILGAARKQPDKVNVAADARGNGKT